MHFQPYITLFHFFCFIGQICLTNTNSCINIYDKNDLKIALLDFKDKYHDMLDVHIEISFVQMLIKEADTKVDEMTLKELNRWRIKLCSNNYLTILILAFCYI